MKIVLTALLTLATLGLTGPLMAFEPDKNDALQLDVARAIVNIRKADPGIETFTHELGHDADAEAPNVVAERGDIVIQGRSQDGTGQGQVQCTTGSPQTPSSHETFLS